MLYFGLKMICQGLINWFNLLKIKNRQVRRLNLLSSWFLNYYYYDCYYYYTTTTVVISQEFCHQDIFFYFNDYICLNILIRNSALLKLHSSLLAKQLCSQMLGCYKELNSNRKAGKKRKKITGATLCLWRK